MAKKPIKLNQYTTRLQKALSDKKILKQFRNNEKAIDKRTVYTEIAKLADVLNDKITHFTAACELHWLNEGKKNIVFGDEFIDMLARTEFTTTELATINEIKGLETFCITTPKNKKIRDTNGNLFEIPPMLIGIMPYNKWIKEAALGYKTITGCDSLYKAMSPVSNNEYIITITYYKNDTLYNTTETLNNLNKLISKDGYNLPIKSKQAQIDPEATAKNNALLKLVLAFFIYTSAKNSENLTKGYPENSLITANKGFTKDYWDTYTAQYSPTWKGYKTPDQVIPCQLINITDPAEYQGSNSWMEIGSLWKLVDEH